MTPEDFTAKLKAALGEHLMTVALYGSAVVDDRAEGYSDINLLVVCDRLAVPELEILSPLAIEWASSGNPPPLLFTNERLLNSSHAFPIELLDIKENHRILHGENVLRALPISQVNLQFQLEHELKGKLIHLRERYLLAGPDEQKTLELMLQSLSSFQIMLKAALRFYEVSVPVKKRDAVRLLAKHVSFDLSVFAELQELRDGAVAQPEGYEAVRSLLGRYLEAIEQSADLIAEIGRRQER